MYRVDPHLANVLGALALRVADEMSRALTAGPVTHPSDATALIALLNFADGERPETLGSALALSQPGTAHVVDRLVSAGHVRRAPDPDDGRAIRLRLTPAGRRHAEALLAARGEVLQRALAGVAPARQRELGAVLDALTPGDAATVAAACRLCRLCDAGACGHDDGRCPVTLQVDAATGRSR